MSGPRPKLVASLALAAAILPLAACSSEEEPSASTACEPIAEVETLHAGKLTAWTADYPPWVSLEGDHLVGPDGDLLERVADALCLDLDPHAQSFASVIEGLKSQRADISAGEWVLDEERQELFEVSEPVYATSGSIVSADGIATIDDLIGKTVGTPQGYSWVPDMIATFGDSNVKQYPSEQAVIDDIGAGRLDAGIVGSASGNLILESSDSDLQIVPLPADDRIQFTVSPGVSVVLMTKGNTALKAAVDQVIEGYRSSGDLATALEGVGVEAAKATP